MTESIIVRVNGAETRITAGSKIKSAREIVIIDRATGAMLKFKPRLPANLPRLRGPGIAPPQE